MEILDVLQDLGMTLLSPPQPVPHHFLVREAQEPKSRYPFYVTWVVVGPAGSSIKTTAALRCKRQSPVDVLDRYETMTECYRDALAFEERIRGVLANYGPLV